MPILSVQPSQSVALSSPLPVQNESFQRNGLVLRQGQFSLVAAAPGVGKTLFATNLSIRTRVPVLYFSADSDEWTVRQRACSILSGRTLDDVESDLGEESWQKYYGDLLRKADHIDWSFRSDLNLEYVAHRIDAFAEVRGHDPKLVILDNLGNTVTQDGGDEYAELRATCRDIQRMARGLSAHFMALHHVKGAKENGDIPIGQGDLLGNLAKIPEQVLGLNRVKDDPRVLNLTVAKNRAGKSGLSMRVPITKETATVGGFYG